MIKYTVQETTVTLMLPGDVFLDADGVIWIALHNDKSPDRPTHASLCWHTERANRSHVSMEGEYYRSLGNISGPFTLLARLSEVA